MQANQKQLSFTDIYSDLEQYLMNYNPQFLKLLEEHINFKELILNTPSSATIIKLPAILESINYHQWFCSFASLLHE